MNAAAEHKYRPALISDRINRARAHAAANYDDYGLNGINARVMILLAVGRTREKTKQHANRCPRSYDFAFVHPPARRNCLALIDIHRD